jgi:hypothetical protein
MTSLSSSSLGSGSHRHKHGGNHGHHNHPHHRHDPYGGRKTLPQLPGFGDVGPFAEVSLRIAHTEILTLALECCALPAGSHATITDRLRRGGPEAWAHVRKRLTAERNQAMRESNTHCPLLGVTDSMLDRLERILTHTPLMSTPARDIVRDLRRRFPQGSLGSPGALKARLATRIAPTVYRLCALLAAHGICALVRLDPGLPQRGGFDPVVFHAAVRIGPGPRGWRDVALGGSYSKLVQGLRPPGSGPVGPVAGVKLSLEALASAMVDGGEPDDITRWFARVGGCGALSGAGLGAPRATDSYACWIFSFFVLFF